MATLSVRLLAGTGGKRVCKKNKKKRSKGRLENPKSSICLDLEKKQTDPGIFLKQDKLQCNRGYGKRMFLLEALNPNIMGSTLEVN